MIFKSFFIYDKMSRPMTTRYMNRKIDVVDDKLYVKKEEYDKLKNRVKELEIMVEALWDAPGMPGAMQKMQEWNDL